MYYCSNCGIVIFYNRPDNDNKSEKPYLDIECKVCNSKGFRKVLPEFFNAANLSEVDHLIEKVENIVEED